MITLVHGSDVHFGKPHLPKVAEVFANEVHALNPDLLVISGDLTQRAKPAEYAQAASWLKSFGDLPVVTTPGNHDVPLYRVFERLFDPYRNWKRHISPDLNSITRIQGMTVVALNSAAPRSAIVNGRLLRSQLEFAREAFAAAPAGDVKLLVAHHHMVSAPDHESDSPIHGARRLLREFKAMGVEIIMGGHLHRAYTGSSADAVPSGDDRDRILVIQSGTTSSSRGRAREKNKNSYNVVQIEEDRVTVIPHLYHADPGAFRPMGLHVFPRSPSTVLDLEAAGETVVEVAR